MHFMYAVEGTNTQSLFKLSFKVQGSTSVQLEKSHRLKGTGQGVVGRGVVGRGVVGRGVVGRGVVGRGVVGRGVVAGGFAVVGHGVGHAQTYS